MQESQVPQPQAVRLRERSAALDHYHHCQDVPLCDHQSCRTKASVRKMGPFLLGRLCQQHFREILLERAESAYIELFGRAKAQESSDSLVNGGGTSSEG